MLEFFYAKLHPEDANMEGAVDRMKQNKRKQSKRKAAGFTLAEIMISVSIIALVTAIAVPVFTRVRIGANESGARKALLTYRNAFIS
jgi:prepilin-type N-terminal cleavage/methylation domain-containing protein